MYGKYPLDVEKVYYTFTRYMVKFDLDRNCHKMDWWKGEILVEIPRYLRI